MTKKKTKGKTPTKGKIDEWLEANGSNGAVIFGRQALKTTIKTMLAEVKNDPDPEAIEEVRSEYLPSLTEDQLVLEIYILHNLLAHLIGRLAVLTTADASDEMQPAKELMLVASMPLWAAREIADIEEAKLNSPMN